MALTSKNSPLFDGSLMLALIMRWAAWAEADFAAAGAYNFFQSISLGSGWSNDSKLLHLARKSKNQGNSTVIDLGLGNRTASWLMTKRTGGSVAELINQGFSLPRLATLHQYYAAWVDRFDVST